MAKRKKGSRGSSKNKKVAAIEKRSAADNLLGLPQADASENRAAMNRMKQEDAHRITHHMRLGLTDAEYSQLKAWSKEKRMPMSRLMRELAFGHSAGGRATQRMLDVIDSVYVDDSALLDYFMKRKKVITAFNRLGGLLNQAVRKLNSTDTSNVKAMRKAANEVLSAAGPINKLLAKHLAIAKQEASKK